MGKPFDFNIKNIEFCDINDYIYNIQIKKTLAENKIEVKKRSEEKAEMMIEGDFLKSL